MNKLKSILITTDFSGHARYTLKFVLSFLQDTQIPCRILLLNTYLVPHTDAKKIIAVNDEMKMKSKSGLQAEQVLAMGLVKNPLITIETTSHIGSVKNVISQLLQKEKFDMVAMGKDGGRHIESVTELLKEKECPILITYLKH